MDASLCSFSYLGICSCLVWKGTLSTHRLISVDYSYVLTLNITRYYSSVADAEEEM